MYIGDNSVVLVVCRFDAVDIGAAGAVALADALKTNRTLTTLT